MDVWRCLPLPWYIFKIPCFLTKNPCSCFKEFRLRTHSFWVLSTTLGERNEPNSKFFLFFSLFIREIILINYRDEFANDCLHRHFSSGNCLSARRLPQKIPASAPLSRWCCWPQFKPISPKPLSIGQFSLNLLILSKWYGVLLHWLGTENPSQKTP